MSHGFPSANKILGLKLCCLLFSLPGKELQEVLRYCPQTLFWTDSSICHVLSCQNRNWGPSLPIYNRVPESRLPNSQPRIPFFSLESETPCFIFTETLGTFARENGHWGFLCLHRVGGGGLRCLEQGVFERYLVERPTCDWLWKADSPGRSVVQPRSERTGGQP